MSKLTKADVRSFIDALGGPAQLARELGIGLSTVAYWRQKGTLPRWRWAELGSVADRLNAPTPKPIVDLVKARAA